MASIAGAVILPDPNRTFLFKNRDLTSESHEDVVVYDPDFFGVRGFDGGIAIGVNRHGLAVANTHVKATADPSYHGLTEQLLLFAKDAEDALSMTADHLKSGRVYQWSNLILADKDSMLVIELAGSEHNIEWSERKVLRTSHHIMLDTEDDVRQAIGDAYEHSIQRLDRGYELMRQASRPEHVFSLLKDHGGTPGQSSLCRHGSGGEYSTVMGYVVEVDFNTESGRPKTVIHVAKGNPCQASFTAIPLIFPADDEIVKRAISMYPK